MSFIYVFKGKQAIVNNLRKLSMRSFLLRQIKNANTTISKSKHAKDLNKNLEPGRNFNTLSVERWFLNFYRKCGLPLHVKKRTTLSLLLSSVKTARGPKKKQRKKQTSKNSLILTVFNGPYGSVELNLWNLLSFAIGMQSVLNTVKGTALGVAEYLTPVLKVGS